MNRRAIAILGAIFFLIIGTLGFIVYSRYAKKEPAVVVNNPATTTPTNVNNPDNQDTQTNNNPDTNNPDTSANVTGPVKLSTEQVISPALFFDGQGVVYVTPEGQFYKVNFVDQNGQVTLGRKEQVEIEARNGISKILWPKEGKDFMAEFNVGGNKKWSLFHFDTGAYIDLPEQISWLDWMPDGQKIVYLWNDGKKTTLNISDPDTKNWNELAEMWENDDAIHVSPDAKNILFYRTQNTDINNKLTMVSTDGKLWQDMAREGFNYGVLWSPDGKKFLFGKKERSTLKYQLWLYDLYTGEVRNLGLFTTPDKAVWDPSGEYIYVAVPSTGTAGTNQLTQDTFFKMNVKTFEKKEFLTGSVVVDGRDLLVSSNNKYLYFKNAQDGYLYYLNIQ